MNQKLPNEKQQQELSREEVVSRYLDENPDYLADHPDVLIRLNIPHLETGAAVSLIQRQVRVLREQNQAARQQLQHLLTIARENDRLGERLHHFALSMLGSDSLDEVLDGAREVLREEFNIDEIAMWFNRKPRIDNARPEFARCGEAAFVEVLKRIGGNDRNPAKPICGATRNNETLAGLFAASAATIRSHAIVPLGGTPPEGVLALGSNDPNRFRPQMGTVYLTHFGELLYRSVAKYLQ